ncbi:hypothetical protein [Moorena sp. SIO3I6]|nr:hypothetical protein [Moorena sp. SIO3I6]NEP28268.1 hypothetical protein [Moorena sp. SIO3I6]
MAKGQAKRMATLREQFMPIALLHRLEVCATLLFAQRARSAIGAFV